MFWIMCFLLLRLILNLVTGMILVLLLKTSLGYSCNIFNAVFSLSRLHLLIGVIIMLGDLLVVLLPCIFFFSLFVNMVQLLMIWILNLYWLGSWNHMLGTWIASNGNSITVFRFLNILNIGLETSLFWYFTLNFKLIDDSMSDILNRLSLL